MEFRQLEAFCAIIEWNSFSEAARQLSITQPTISSHIQSLEQSLNTQLFDRSTKPVSITAEGQQFYEQAKGLLRLREKVLREFDHTAQEVIRLGASSIPAVYLLPELLAAFRQACPEPSFDVSQLDSSALLTQLQAGSVDIGFSGIPLSDDSFCCQSIYQDEMVLAVPDNAHFRALRQRGASLPQLLQEPYLLREDGSGTKKEAEQFLETLGLDRSNLQIAARINNLEAIKQSIIYGLGVSILSKKVTADLERDQRVIAFPLANGGIYRSYYLIYRRSKIQSQQLWHFIQFAEGFYPKKN